MWSFYPSKGISLCPGIYHRVLVREPLVLSTLWNGTAVCYLQLGDRESLAFETQKEAHQTDTRTHHERQTGGNLEFQSQFGGLQSLLIINRVQDPEKLKYR